MFPFKNMMFPLSSMFKNNQMGFNPFELHSQMMKHPMANGGQSFPFNMMTKNPMAGGGNQGFPFNMAKQNQMPGGAQSSPFNMGMGKQKTMTGGAQSFPFNMMQQSPMVGGINTFPFNYENQPVQEENPFSNNFFQSQTPQQIQNQQNPGHNQQAAPSQFPYSLIRDQNGNIDFNKIGNGVQSTLGLVGQMGPMFKLFSGFFR
ncbi:MAG: hypothetical protein ACK4M9_11300 [Anaerobacillus sp.]|uniref:hypothetical protein n=1 Tax=Anaerobacillus sp. TaxID=1872506 RepID=UPI00391CEB91